MLTAIKTEFANLIWFCRTFPFIALCLAIGGSVTGAALGYYGAKVLFMVGYVTGYALATLLA